MAVTLTVVELAASMRLGDGTTAPTAPLDAILARLLAVGTVTAELTAPAAPEQVLNEAVVRMAAYAYDTPSAGRHSGYADAWNNSGAASVCARWIVRRAR